jgi:hypothetical protein
VGSAVDGAASSTAFVKDDVALNPNARQIFGQVGRTAGQLNNPCSIGIFFGASAGVGGGVAVGSEGALTAVAVAESHGIPAAAGLARLYGNVRASWAGFITKMATKVSDAVVGGCSALNKIDR